MRSVRTVSPLSPAAAQDRLAGATPARAATDTVQLLAPVIDTFTASRRAQQVDLGAASAPNVAAVAPPTGTNAGPPIVVVMDSGVDIHHPDLNDALFVNPGEIAGDGIDNDQNGVVDDVHGLNVTSGDGNLIPGDVHGTHVAGIIGAEDNGFGVTGVAGGAVELMIINRGSDGLLESFETAVDYVVKMKEAGHNIRVLNASFGTEAHDPAHVQRWDAAVARLEAADILLVAATANNGRSVNDVPDMPANIDRTNVVTVAALNDSNDHLASYSAHGDEAVEIAAVGSQFSTVDEGEYDWQSGTSMAAPVVSGAAARIFAINPDLKAADARRILMETAEKDPDLDGKVSTGGKLNVQRAEEAARATLLDAPVEARSLNWFGAA